MSKLNKSLIVTTIILFLVSGFSIYFAFNCWQDEKTAQDKVTELTHKIEQLEQKAESDNQIVANNEHEKVKLENQSQERQAQINEQLKDNDCANRFVLMPISASLYNRAKSLRESTNTSKSIK